MSKDDAQWVRCAKLGAVAGSIALCLVGIAFLLNGAPRFIAFGAAGGLAFAAITAPIGAYRRRKPLDTSRVAVSAKGRKMRNPTTAAIIIGGGLGVVLPHLPAALLSYAFIFWGVLIGVFGFGALLLSPLFSPPTAARPPVSPLSRMTTMERARRQNYE
jgi:hypothetical protein